jgi:protein-tyrosine phosphatase
MTAEVFWTKEKYPGRIALVPRPRGGEWLEDEAAAWSKAGLDVIVSMLDAEEIAWFELEREAEFCAENGIEFISCPVTDRSVPEINETFLKTVGKLKNLLLKGKNVGIHCRQSVGRAPLMAAVLMITFGVEPVEAFRQLSVVRGVEVPETDEQRKWAERFAGETAMALG